MDIALMIGRNIRFMRTVRGMTIKQLADAIADLGVVYSADTIGRWQRGAVPIPADAVYWLSKALKCTVYSLYYSDRGESEWQERLIDELKELPSHEQEDLLWLATQWNGQTHALVECATLYACLPVVSREYIARQCLDEYALQSQAGKVDDAMSINLDLIQNGWKMLDKEKGDE